MNAPFTHTRVGLVAAIHPADAAQALRDADPAPAPFVACPSCSEGANAVARYEHARAMQDWRTRQPVGWISDALAADRDSIVRGLVRGLS